MTSEITGSFHFLCVSIHSRTSPYFYHLIKTIRKLENLHTLTLTHTLPPKYTPASQQRRWGGRGARRRAPGGRGGGCEAGGSSLGASSKSAGETKGRGAWASGPHGAVGLPVGRPGALTAATDGLSPWALRANGEVPDAPSLLGLP